MNLLDDNKSYPLQDTGVPVKHAYCGLMGEDIV
jgi:hypothetical protein